MAGVCDTTGAVGLISVPPDRDFRASGQNTGFEAWVLEERQNVLLDRGVIVNTSEPGYYDEDGDLYLVTIPAGTRVDSHYVYARKDGAESAHDGEIVFDGPILGVIVRTLRLYDSNFLGIPGVLYPGNNNSDLGLEFYPEVQINIDTFTISPDRRILTIHLMCGTPGDRIRVLTAPPCTAADLDADRVVDLGDLARLLAHFGTPSDARCADGDLDFDGDVDLSDLASLLADFGTSCP